MSVTKMSVHESFFKKIKAIQRLMFLRQIYRKHKQSSMTKAGFADHFGTLIPFFLYHLWK